MKKKIGIILLLILLVFLVGCSKSSEKVKENKSSKEEAQEQVYYEKKALDATININTDSSGFGAGFIYSEIYIVTNYHVVYNAKEINIITYNKDEYKASLVGFNVERDIAILKIDRNLDSMEIGDSEKIKAGTKVTAIGNPNGDLSFLKAEGILLNVPQELLDQIDKERKYLWYDGNAISGFSGGPVIDKEGKVIGILNARYNGDLSNYNFDNLCALIPINEAVPIINKIINENQ